MMDLPLFVVSEESGLPRSGIPVVLEARLHSEEDEPADGADRIVSLGLRQTDPNGFVSFDLSRFNLRPTEDDPSRLRITSGRRELVVDHLWLHPAAEREFGIDVVPHLTLDPPSAPVVLSVPDAVPSLPGRSLPSSSSREAADLSISPFSVGSRGAALVGEDGCEEFLPSAIGTRTYRFSHMSIDPDEPRRLRLTEGECDPDRGEFDPPPPCVRFGILHEYRMDWFPIGHALGEVAYSLALAPCESVNLAFVDWSREDVARRAEEQVVTEELLHAQRRDRVVEETVHATVSEWQRGGSILGGGSIIAPLGEGIMGAFSLSGGYSTSSGDRTVDARNVQRLSDSVQQASTSVRSRYGTVVVQSSEAESEALQTRTVRNNNHCHALTVLYYEVLRQYRTVTALDGRTDVILVQFPTPRFDRATALCHRAVLEAHLLEPDLARCFEAMARLQFADDGNQTAADDLEGVEADALIVTLRVGEEGGGSDNEVRVQLEDVDGRIMVDWSFRARHLDPRDEGANLFEAGSVNVYRLEMSGPADEAVKIYGENKPEDADPLPVDQIHRVLVHNDSGDSWTLERVVVEYRPLDAPVTELSSDRAEDPEELLSPLPHLMTQDTFYISSPLSELREEERETDEEDERA